MILAAALLLQAVALPGPGGPCPPEVVEAMRVHDGVYVDDFEGQRFFEGARSWDQVDRRLRPTIWMTFDVVGAGEPFGITRRVQGQAYHIRFLGQSRSRGAGHIPCGYGHMSMFDADMRMKRLLAIEPLPAPAARP